MLSGQGRSANSQQTHEMTVPNELIGCIIGKGGSKVAEIRCVFIPAMMGVQLVPFLKLKEMFISSPQKNMYKHFPFYYIALSFHYNTAKKQAFKLRSHRNFIWHLDAGSDDLLVQLLYLYFITGISIFQTLPSALTHFNKFYTDSSVKGSSIYRNLYDISIIFIWWDKFIFSCKGQENFSFDLILPNIRQIFPKYSDNSRGQWSESQTAKTGTPRPTWTGRSASRGTRSRWRWPSTWSTWGRLRSL